MSSLPTTLTFAPLQAVLGGLFLGTASGLLMLFSGKIAGNSGALKSVVMGEFDVSKTSFLGGLLAAGAFFSAVLPSAFEASPAPSIGLFAGALCTGLGTSLANGCTSGHGLCGCSRLSPRSFAAVPVFMIFAAASTTIKSGIYAVGELAPLAEPVAGVLMISLYCAAGLAAALVGILTLLPRGELAPPLGRPRALRNHSPHQVPSTGSLLGFHKIFVHFEAFVYGSIILYCPPHLHCPYACNTIARLLRNIRPPLDYPFVCHTPYHIGHNNIV